MKLWSSPHSKGLKWVGNVLDGKPPLLVVNINLFGCLTDQPGRGQED
jgi:hypothetical protein